MLHQAGAQLLVSDVNAAAAARVANATGATIVGAAGILSAKADIFAPCALGGVIDEVAAGKLRAKVVCGAANNQLATTADGDRLAQRNILYALDYVVNAGGIINRRSSGRRVHPRRNARSRATHRCRSVGSAADRQCLAGRA